MKFTKSTSTVSLLIVGLGLCSATAATIRVPQDQATITAGVAAAQDGDTVAVSSGTYYEHNIQITKNITVTSLSGATSTIVDNQHLGRGFIVTGATLVDVNIIGLTIQNGQTPQREEGGAIRIVSGKCKIGNCIIQGVLGDAAYGAGPIGNITTNVDDVIVYNSIIRNCFGANCAGIAGCAVYGCLIYNNSGGNNPRVLISCHATNCTVYGNTGGNRSNPWTVAGMSYGTAVNCIFWGNEGYNGQQVYQPESIIYSTIQGGYAGTGNLSSDPLFVNVAAGDFHLQANSPAKHSGNPTILNADGSRSDMGAYGGNFAVQPCIPHRASATAMLDHGFVVAATITDGGCGYTNTPVVSIRGGGGTGATATAVVSDGVVVNIIITDAGIGYTSMPTIYISSPLGLQVALIKAVKPSFLNLSLGSNYQMQISTDMSTWSNYGAAFTATNTSMVYPQYFDVDNWNSLLFRVKSVP
jgi:hypothetical protein